MKRILVVDDEENIRMLYQEELQEEGYEVVLASNGIEAMETLASKGSFDLVTLDIRMPGMDGINTVREIKQRYRKIPVILVTAYGEYKQDFSTWASDAYIVKSADLSELKATIKRILE